MTVASHKKRLKITTLKLGRQGGYLFLLFKQDITVKINVAI